MKVLVIEDSRMLRLATERILVKNGYEVTGIGDGHQGILLAQQSRPDAILLDMMLPGLEGTKVLDQLKQNKATESIPVIVLSGLSEERGKAQNGRSSRLF